MKTRSATVRPLAWLCGAMAIALACPGYAEEGDDVAFYKGKGFVVIAETSVDEPVFEGCEVDMVVPLANGQSFVCAENGSIPLEVYPDAVILRHPASGEIKVVIATYGLKGVLQGTPKPEPAAKPSPARTAPAVAVTAPPPAVAAPPVAAPVAAPAVAAPPPPPTPSPTPATNATTPPPGPKPFPPALAAPAPVPAPAQVELIAPVAGTWRTSAVVSGSQVEAVAMLDANGNFNRFERWSFGLTVQIWGTYVVSPIEPTRLQMTQRPTGWQPKEWCVRGSLCTALTYPESAAQFTFLDRNTLRDETTKAVYKRE
jgi:hypothetical protein